MRLKMVLLLFLLGGGLLPLLACNGGGGSAAAVDPPAVADLDAAPPTDPLFPYQWHIKNTGQKTFSRSAGTAGCDLNTNQAILDRINGSGVIVAIVDSGLEIAHEDLVKNVIVGGSYNFVTKTTDPSPAPGVTTGDHGTSVAGIIAAEANNGKGGSGVAPKAGLKGFNVLAAPTPTHFVESLGGHDRSQDVHIFNMSYGAEGNKYIPLSQTEQDLYESTKTLRGGKGALYVKSAGNGYDDLKLDDKSSYECAADTTSYPAAAVGIRRLDVTCENAVADETNSRPELIVVGAYNAAGVKASYSTAGPTLWVSAPGGEFGSASPAILTTDQSGCDRGYSRSRGLYPGTGAAANDFETGETDNDGRYNAGCNYTSTFNGTSAAAPSASGAVALILQANPSLTRRDVKHILARTARPIDATIAERTVTISGKAYVAEQAWITNNAVPGYRFHNWYGFGALDVDAAVAMAKTYPLDTLGTLQEKAAGGDLATPLAIPDQDADGASAKITFPDNLTIENIAVAIALDHPNTGEVGIELTSPGGTKSILLNIRSALRSGLYEFDNTTKKIVPAVLSSNAFYGEKSGGDWTIRVVDGVPGKTGSLKHFAIAILGY